MSLSTQKPTTQIAGLVVAIISISTASIFIRFAQSGVPSLTIATFRLAFASLFLLPFFIIRLLKGNNSRLTTKEFKQIFLSSVFLAFHFAFWISSLEKTGITSSVVLVTTTPIWVSLLSKLILAEEVRQRVWIGLIISFIGLLFITHPFRYGFSLPETEQEVSDVMIGNMLALAGALCAAGYVLTGKIVRKSIPIDQYVFLVDLLASLILFALAFFFGEFDLSLQPVNWLWLILLALIPQFIGHSLINWVLGVLPAVYVSLALLGEPVGSTILAYFFLKEIPSLSEIIGALIILSGIVFATNPIIKKEGREF